MKNILDGLKPGVIEIPEDKRAEFMRIFGVVEIKFRIYDTQCFCYLGEHPEQIGYSKKESLISGHLYCRVIYKAHLCKFQHECQVPDTYTRNQIINHLTPIIEKLMDEREKSSALN